MKYGIKQNITGIYKITCKINGKVYIGASVNVAARIGNHMNRDARKYLNSEFYSDVRKYGRQGFDFELLEECVKDKLLEREQYYFDKLNPCYNFIRPTDNNFKNSKVREKSIKAAQTKEKVQRRKELYNTDIYQEYFQSMHKNKMRAVEMTDESGNIIKFISIRDCARYLDWSTDYKSKNKASKVKAVCDGERKKAFGCTFRYLRKPVETIQ